MRIYLASGTAIVPKIIEEQPHLEPYAGWLNTPRSAMSFDTLKKTGLPIGVDNSAFTYFDEKKYLSLVSRISGNVQWLTMPDVVADAKTTTQLFNEWKERITDIPLAYVGQDGCEDIDIPWTDIRCFFIGGSTEWKLSQTTATLVAHAQQLGKLIHMGRVNSQKRLRYAHWLGCDSVDGSGYSRFSNKYLARSLEFLHSLHTDQQLYCL